ncbi:MAG: hypothetical protein K1V84_01110 [Muribaculaceae bacterium]
MKPVNTLLEIMKAGASITVNGHGVSSTSLTTLAKGAAAFNVHLTIRGVSGTSIITLQDIAKAGAGHVTLDFCE